MSIKERKYNKYDTLQKGRWLSKEKTAANKVKFWKQPRKGMLCEKMDNSLAKLNSAESNLHEMEYGDRCGEYNEAKAGMMRRTIAAIWRNITCGITSVFHV